MSAVQKPPAPRFRIVLEASFPDADVDPTGYADLIARWEKSLESNPVFPCKDVKVRETSTIGDVDDYTDWRYHRGEYDVSTWPRETLGTVHGLGRPGKKR